MGLINECMLTVLVLATLTFVLVELVDDCSKVRYRRQERDRVKECAKLIVQLPVSMIAVYALYKTHVMVTMIFSNNRFQFLPYQL